MAVLKGKFEITVEVPDDEAEELQLFHFDYGTFEEALPEAWEVSRASRIAVERLD